MNHEQTMNINRHNYEEYFLLYVDNELSAAERNAVELFLRENPDLRQELSLLQQTILEIPGATFGSKQNLHRTEEPTALQSGLLSYLDNELSETEKQELEKQVAGNLDAIKELNSLRRTKLEPETIVFTDKASLYRREETVVVRMKWWRVAAAALLLGFGTWMGVRYFSTRPQPAGKPETEIAKTNTGNPGTNGNTQPANTTSGTSGPVVANTEENRQSPNDNISATPVQENKQQRNNALPVNTTADVKNNLPQPAQNNVADNNLPVNKNSNNLPKSYLENINNQGSNSPLVANVTPKNENSNGINSGNDNQLPASSNRNTYTTSQPGDMNLTPAMANNNATVPAVYASNNNNDRVLDLQDDRGKRSKLGGLLRKVKRVIERNTNIKTGDEVKVAGFEIAIK